MTAKYQRKRSEKRNGEEIMAAYQQQMASAKNMKRMAYQASAAWRRNNQYAYQRKAMAMAAMWHGSMAKAAAKASWRISVISSSGEKRNDIKQRIEIMTAWQQWRQ